MCSSELRDPGVGQSHLSEDGAAYGSQAWNVSPGCLAQDPELSGQSPSAPCWAQTHLTAPASWKGFVALPVDLSDVTAQGSGMQPLHVLWAETFLFQVPYDFLQVCGMWISWVFQDVLNSEFAPALLLGLLPGLSRLKPHSRLSVPRFPVGSFLVLTLSQ